MTVPVPRRTLATALLAAFSLLLTGCLVSPGRFASQLVLERDGSFAFSYEGEIFFLGLSKLAQMGAGDESFEPEACHDGEGSERECSAAELAEQRAAWEEGAEERAAKARKEAQEMARMMGGIDPTDPQAAEELRALLLRHRGWNRVEHKGDGLFNVSYRVSGRLSHDLVFPLIEGFPTTNPFVQVILRDGNAVRVNAPGFAAQGEGNPMGQVMGGMAGLAALGAGQSGENEMPEIPQMEGSFTIVTNGRILANNTDEGPSASGNRARLEWRIDQRTQAAPTALIDFSPG